MTGAIFVGSVDVFGFSNHIVYIYDPDGDLTTEEAGRRIIQGFAGDVDNVILPLAGSFVDLDMNESGSLFGDLVIESTTLDVSVELGRVVN